MLIVSSVALFGTAVPGPMIAEAADSAGQRQREQQDSDQDRPLKLKSNLVILSAAVADREGRAMRTLTKDDFTIYENGLKQTIAEFDAVEEPFSLILMLDISGSTTDEIELMKQAAANFLAELKKDDRVGVVVFAREIELIAEFTDKRAKVMSAIAAIAATSGDEGRRFSTNTGTSFYDSLYLAVKESPLKGVKGRKAIICMSDGVDSTSKMAYDEVAKLVERSEASVYLLQLNTEEATLEGLLKPPTDEGYINLSPSQVKRYYDEYEPASAERVLPRSSLSPAKRREINKALYEMARREMGELAEHTGGRVLPVATLDDLAGVYKQVADDLHSQYSIGYYSTNTTSDGRWRSIKVRVRNSAATVRARSGYWAPGKQ